MFAILPLLLRSRLGWVGVLIALALYFFGGSLGRVFTGSERAHGEAPAGRSGSAAENEMVEFVSFVLDDVQATWQRELANGPVPYHNAKLVLFTDATRTGCGYGEAATGPFYCPNDERVYIDLGFYRELAQRFGAKGDFAQAYVIAHEIGHHVQKLMGISERVHQAPRAQQTGAEGLSVRLELQADCFAGIWASSTANRNLLEAGDIDEALGAATAIGDDRLQRQSTGTVNPESWTHGSSAERTRWFKRGYEQGRIEACDTFNASTL